MRILIESTDDLTPLNDVPVRRWKGVSSGGIECHVFVHRVAVLRTDDNSQFEAELKEQSPPAVAISIDADARAKGLRDQVLKIWNPPRIGMGTIYDVAQTAVMQTLAFVMGRQFLAGLTPVQQAVIDQGQELMEQTIRHGGNHATSSTSESDS